MAEPPLIAALVLFDGAKTRVRLVCKNCRKYGAKLSDLRRELAKNHKLVNTVAIAQDDAEPFDGWEDDDD